MSLQIVRRRVEVNAPLAAVLSLTLDAARYPEFAPSIDSTELIWHDQANQKYLIRYVSTIPVIQKTAVSEQEVHYDIASTTFNFRETKGTFGRFEGYRKLAALGPGRSAIESEVRYSFGGNKLIAGLVNKATQGLVQSNLEHIQEGIKRLAEGGKADPLHVVLDKLEVTPQMLLAQGVTRDILLGFGIEEPAFV
ncbi:MAG: SRPBCC family protein [Spirochaetes bacterium]|nr:SRPBCC family protein [Spirochaetota bacterium]